MTFQTFTGMQYLQIDIANNFGLDLDKKDWNSRLAWFSENESKLESLLSQAENPALFYAGVQAYQAALKGEAIGYPISLDSCSSGMQILACLVQDRQAASLCGVVDTGHREDAYTNVYRAMLGVVGEQPKLKRSLVKEAVMTSLYSSTAVPKKVFGEKTVLLSTFYKVMEIACPLVWKLNTAFLGLWDPEAEVYNWTLPDNFHVRVKVKREVEEQFLFRGYPEKVISKINAPTPEGRSLSANTTHSVDGYVVRELVRRCSYDPEKIMQIKTALCGNPEPERMDEDKANMVRTLWQHYEQTKMLSIRILDYLDEDTISLVPEKEVIWQLIYSLPKKPFQVLTIHDAFRVLPHYGNDLRKQYNILLSEIAKSNLLNTILSSITGRKIELGQNDPEMSKDILEANYTLS